MPRPTIDLKRYVNPIAIPPKPSADEAKVDPSLDREWHRVRAEHDKLERELLAQFRADAVQAAGLSRHPRGEDAFDVAFQECWITSGISGVWNLFTDIAALLKPRDRSDDSR